MNPHSIRTVIHKSVEETLEVLGRMNGAAISTQVEDSVRAIIDDVRLYGDRALLRYTAQFDKVKIKAAQIRVPRQELEAAARFVSPAVRRLINETIRNVRLYHEIQKRRDRLYRSRKGFTILERFIPINRVGVYIPAGTAPLVSSVIMTVIPARTAGVKEIVLCTPPGKDGTVNTHILAAAHLAGCKAVFRAGGAQAVAAMAYGTESVPSVDKICGPGNIYVTAAKKIVFGDVGIDMIAGPSEVAVIADAESAPGCVACDLLAQLEHDVQAKAVLIYIGSTDRQSLTRLDRIKKTIAHRAQKLSRQSILCASVPRNLLVVQVPHTDAAVEVADAVAPEHLEILCAKPDQVARRIHNCSAVFVGRDTCVPLGDFWAGPSHVLPTGRSARFSSGLNVSDFLKVQNIIKFTPQGVRQAEEAARYFARTEGLDAHEQSIVERLNPRQD